MDSSYYHDCVITAITYSPAQLSCDTWRDGAAGGGGRGRAITYNKFLFNISLF